MKNKILLIIIILLYPIFSFPQGINVKKYKQLDILPTPDVFSTYPKSSFIRQINEDTKYIQNYLDARGSELGWIVHSDRDDNQTFHEPNEGEKKYKINFMDEFYVNDVRNNYLHLVKLKTSGVSGMKIDKEMGWIHANKLILSQYPILSENGAPIKRMILMSASDLPDDLEKQKNYKKLFDDKNYFTNPVIKNKNFINKYKSKRKADKLQILFVLKEDENSNAVLLSPSDKIETTDDVYGWYLNIKTTAWNTRVCLEPISGREVDKYFKKDSEDKYPSNYVFLNNYDLNTYVSNSQNISDETFLREIHVRKQRMRGMSMRYPVMPWVENGTKRKKIAVIAQLGDFEEIDGAVCPPECQRAKAKRELDSINKLQNNVNVLVVIDGTESMKSYGPQVATSIQKIINERALEGKQNLKWGLAVYRDYADKDKLFELIRLTDDENAVINKLKKGNIQFFSEDPGHSEAHYYGMTKAITEAGFKNGESNIIILVGDAGNHENDRDNLTKNSVIKLLSRKNINLISFQTNLVGGANIGIYSKFSRDSRSYIKQTAKNYISRLKNSEGLGVKLMKGNVKNSYQLGFKGFKSDLTKPSFGFFNHATEGKNLPVSEFRKNLVNTFLEYMNQLDNRAEALDCIVRGDCLEDDDSTVTTEDEWFDGRTSDICRMMNWSDDLCSLLVQEGQISISGYTLMHKNGKPTYKSVAYMSTTYKGKLNERLRKLQLVKGSSRKSREKFHETIISLIQGLLVGDENITSDFVEELNKWTFDQTWDVLLGVPFSKNSTLNTKQIGDLLTDNISDSEFEIFLENFKEQTQAFIEFPRDKEEPSTVYRSGSQTFYWIPFEKIPRGEE